jgi:DNA-binding PadR family transcriptional regulator
LSTARLTPFSYCVLALVGQGGAGPHDLTRMMRQQGGLYWSAAESQWYAEPKRLEALGYLRSRKQPGRTRERTHYTLTAAGRKALRQWIAAPSGLPRIQDEAVVRVLAGDLAGDDRLLLASLAALRRELAEQRARFDDAERTAESLPHRRRYLLLVHRLGRLVLDAHEQWLDEVEAELS